MVVELLPRMGSLDLNAAGLLIKVLFLERFKPSLLQARFGIGDVYFCALSWGKLEVIEASGLKWQRRSVLEQVLVCSFVETRLRLWRVE